MRIISLSLSTIFGCIVAIILFLVIFTPEPCEHEDTVERYLFTSYDSPSNSDVCSYCRDCNKRLSAYFSFNGELVDKSYLEAIKEHSGGSEIIPGEYYIVTATAPLGFYNYSSEKVSLTCEVENDDFIVRFNVEFREESWEQVKAIGEGDKLTFRGRFYDEGCGFTDADLIDFTSGR